MVLLGGEGFTGGCPLFHPFDARLSFGIFRPLTSLVKLLLLFPCTRVMQHVHPLTSSRFFSYIPHSFCLAWSAHVRAAAAAHSPSSSYKATSTSYRLYGSKVLPDPFLWLLTNTHHWRVIDCSFNPLCSMMIFPFLFFQMIIAVTSLHPFTSSIWWRAVRIFSNEAKRKKLNGNKEAYQWSWWNDRVRLGLHMMCTPGNWSN